MYIYTYYSIKILDKKVLTLEEIPRSAPVCASLVRELYWALKVGLVLWALKKIKKIKKLSFGLNT